MQPSISIDYPKLATDEAYFRQIWQAINSGEINLDTISEENYDKFLDAQLHWVLKKTKKQPDSQAAQLPDPPPFGVKALVHDFLQVFK